MRTLDPYSGLRQVITGFYTIRRFDAVELTRKYKLTPLEIGYYFIFLTSTDWHPTKYRYGFIRLELNKLTKIWNISLNTLRDNLKKLAYKGVIVFGDKKIPEFTRLHNHVGGEVFTTKAKGYSDEFIENYFDNLFPKSEISLNSKLVSPPPFKNSFKNGLIANPNESEEIKTVMLCQEVKDDAEYQRTYQEGDWGPFTADDMKWVDQNTKQRVVVRDLKHESEIISTYFGGDPEKYKNCLIT